MLRSMLQDRVFYCSKGGIHAFKMIEAEPLNVLAWDKHANSALKTLTIFFSGRDTWRVDLKESTNLYCLEQIVLD